jgi:uncharacterized protein (TIGR00369 family)
MSESLSNLAAWRQSGTVDAHDLERRFNDSPQLRHQGIRVDLSNVARPVVLIDEVLPFHTGALGTEAVHGGMLAMLADLALGLLGLQYFGEGMTATREVHVDLLQPLSGRRVRVESWVVAEAGRRVYGHAHIMDETDRVCAVVTGNLVRGLS